jgi:hypothetical protein
MITPRSSDHGETDEVLESMVHPADEFGSFGIATVFFFRFAEEQQEYGEYGACANRRNQPDDPS